MQVVSVTTNNKLTPKRLLEVFKNGEYTKMF